MSLRFPFRQEKSSIFGVVRRPLALVSVWSQKEKNWSDIWMVVDTGADYTLLPRYLAKDLGVDFKKDCEVFQTLGVGGREKVFLVRKWRVKLGKWEREIPLGFLDSDTVPPLLGRQDFLEDFKVIFEKHEVGFSRPRKR